MKFTQRGYRVAAVVTTTLLTIVMFWGGVGSAAANSTAGTHLSLPHMAPVSLGYRLQITDTTAMTETTDMTDTEETTDTTGTDDTAASDNTTATTINAAMLGGTGPESAFSPTGEQATLDAHARRWYIFKYDYAGGDTEPSRVIAELRMDQPGSLSFEIWSEQNLRQWQNGVDFTPTGAGTPAFAITEDDDANNRDRSLLRWVGGGRATTLYYLIVENNTDMPANYTLTVTGPTVSFPTTTATDMTSSADMTATVGVTTTTDMSAGMMRGGSGPEDALTPTGERTTLGAGERRWYTFKYSFDEATAENDDTEENDASEAIAELRMADPGSLSFEVWSQDDVRNWQNGIDFTPTGAGTPAFAIRDGDDDRDRSLLRWVGSSEATVTYYLIVQNNTDLPATYRLTVTGPTVAFPGVPTADAAMSDSTAMTATMPMTATPDMGDTANMTDTPIITDTAEMAMSSGSSPENAVAITGQRETLAAGEQRWYTFEYAYDEEAVENDDTEENDASNAIVELRMAEPDSLSFEVWSGDNVSQWQNSEDFTPTGAGTPAFAISDGDNSRDRSLLRWVGSSEATVRYYVIVTNNTDAPATYRLTVSGPDVRN